MRGTPPHGCSIKEAEGQEWRARGFAAVGAMAESDESRERTAVVDTQAARTAATDGRGWFRGYLVSSGLHG